MNYIYYEPIKNKFYLTPWQLGDTTSYLHLATDGEHTCRWSFTKPEYRFYYIGEL